MSDQLWRVIRTISLLSTGRRCTSKEILDYLRGLGEGFREVDIRTIQRDMKSLENADIGLYVEKKGQTTYYSLPRASHINLNAIKAGSPLLSLHLLKAALPQFHNLELEGALGDILKELSDEDKADVISNELISSITLGEYIGTSQPESDVLDAIIHAIRAKNWINVTYRDKTNTFQVAPCRLIPYLGRLYLAAWTETHKSYLTLAADRIRSVTNVGSVSAAFPDFTIDAFMANRFGLWSSEVVDDVIVHIHPDAYEQFATRRWHPSQKLTDLPDGGLEIHMRTGIGHELTSWVLHWAPLITVIAPERLKNEVKKKVKVMK